eukprot:scaffold220804_cov19-Tisochrysis_lutea.AAC.4
MGPSRPFCPDTLQMHKELRGAVGVCAQSMKVFAHQAASANVCTSSPPQFWAGSHLRRTSRFHHPETFCSASYFNTPALAVYESKHVCWLCVGFEKRLVAAKSEHFLNCGF